MTIYKINIGGILSDIQIMKVDERNFYYTTLLYETSNKNNSIKFIWSKISEEYVICIRVNNPNAVLEEELNKILGINVEEINS